MPKLAELYTALERAAQANDDESAREIASYIKAMQPPARIMPPEQVMEKPVERSNLRELADIPLKATEGAVAGVRMISDVFGANNAVSKNLRSVEDYVSQLYSAQSKADSQQIAAIMKDAEDKGIGEQVRAGLKAFSVAPVDFLSNAVGTAIPTIAGGLGTGALKIGTMGVRATQLGLGAATGAGVTKGAIYEGVKEALATSAMPADQVEARAQLAQSYNGENLDQILAGTALGGLASTLGIEAKFVPGVANVIRSRAKEALVTGAKEAIPEVLQGSQEQLARNLAVQREGFDVPTMRGVVGQGTLEGLAGAGLGASIGAVSQSRQNNAIEAQQAAEKQQRQAAISKSNVERARQDGLVATARAEAGQTQYASEERAADLAGKAGVDNMRRELETRAESLAPVIQQMGQGITDNVSKLSSTEGIQDLLANFKNYFYFADKKDEAALRKDLQQQLIAAKQVETAEKKLAKLKLQDTSGENRSFAETFQNGEIETDVDSLLTQAFPQGIENATLKELTTQKQELDAVAAGVENKKEIPYYEAVYTRLDDAIAEREAAQEQEITELRKTSNIIKAREKELKIFGNDPMKKEAFEKGPEAWAAYNAQEEEREIARKERAKKVDVPSKLYPTNEASEYYRVPEVSYEEKVAQIKRARNEQEIENFELEEQYQSPSTALNEEPANEATQQAPAGQREIFTKFGQPTAAALRGTADTSGNSQTQLNRANQRNAMPSPSAETNVAETEAVDTGPLGIAGRATGKPEVGTETSEEVQPSTLIAREKAAPIKTVRDAVKAIEDVEAYWVAEDAKAPVDLDDDFVAEFEALKTNIPTQPKAVANWIKNVKTKTQQLKAMVDATVQENTKVDENYDEEVIGYDDLVNEPSNPNDQYFESRKAKTKTKSKNAPKDISGKLREESTEPTTPEIFAEVVSKWFNPVWYKNAIKNGMVNIVDGDINDSDLSDAIKEKYATAKALFTPDGKAYFFIANITKGNELGVFLHEIGEHKGLENLIGKDRVKQLANRVRAMAEGKGKVSAKEIAMAKQAIEMAEGQAQNDKEVIAYFGEIAVFNGVRPGEKAKPEFGKAAGWVTELWNSVKKAIDKLQLNPDKVSDKDIVDMLYGAARLELGADSNVVSAEPTAEEDAILASKARGAYALEPDERSALESQGYVVFDDLTRPNKYQELSELAGNPAKRQASMDKLGNSVFGPLYSLTRKTAALYGGQIKDAVTNKLYGVYVAQHALNANNLSSQATLQGSLEIGKQGEMYVVENEANYQKLAGNWNTLIAAMERDGISKPMAQQYGSLMAVADRYESLIKRGEKTRDEFPIQNTQRANELKARYASEFNAWRDNYTDMRNGMRGVILKSGLMTPKKVDELLNRMEYIPFYRVQDSEAMDGVFIKNLLSAKSEQKLVGGTENLMIGDVMTNIMKNQMWLYNRVIYNHTTNLIVDQVEDMGIGKHLPVRPQKAENIISYLRDGNLKHFQFDDVNDMELFKQQPVIESSALRMMKAFSGILRKTITLTPSFMYRQTWNDALRAWGQSGTDKNFLALLVQSAGEQINNFTGKNQTELAKQLRNRGIIGAIEYQDSYDNFIDNVLGREYKGKFKRLNSFVQTMERAAQNSDMAARAIVYDAAIKEGSTPAEAAVRAQMMLNYQHRGTSPTLRALLTTIPFINTQLQSDWRLLDALKGNVPGLSKAKARQLLGVKVAKFALVTAAYAMMRSGDDDYEDATEENRNRNFLFDVGGVPLRIPVAPEYLILKSSIEQATRLTMDNEFATNRKAGHAVLSGLGNLLLSPTDVMPSVIRPFIENLTNYSFFQDRALVGIDQKRKLTNEQYVKGQTSELSKWLSDFGQEVLGEELNVSPIKLDNLLRGVFGTMGQDVMFVTNVIAESVTGKARPSLKLNQLPEIGTAFYDPQGGQREADYYDLKEKVDKRYNTFLDIRKTDPQRANQFRQENMQYFRVRSQLESIEKQLTNLRARKNKMLENTAMSAPEKAEIRDKITADKKRIIGTRIQKMLESME